MKNFDDWNKIKKDIEKSKIDKVFHTQEIWWCSVGINIGFEEDGKNNNYERPVLILRKFSNDLFIGIPLSTKIKEGEYYINFIDDERLPFSVLLSQTKVISGKRLLRKISKMSRGRFQEVKKAYKDLLLM